MEKEEMNCRERLYATLEQKPVDRVPCPAILQAGTVDLMDACGAAWPEAHWDAEKMAKLAWAAYEVAGLEGIRIPMNVYPESEALGCELDKWKKDNQPMVKGLKEYAIKTLEDIDKIEVPDPKRDGKLLPATVKAIEILAEKCKREKLPLCAQVIGTCVLSTNAGTVDMMKSMMWLNTNKEEIIKLREKIKEVHLTVAEAFINAGADIILYNSAHVAELGKHYMELFYEVDKECIRKDREMGAYVISHICTPKIKVMMKELCEQKPHGISIPESYSAKEAREKVGDKVALIGNVNQLTTLLKGSPERVIEESKKILEEGIDVLAPGCGFGPKTSLANMKAMVEAAKKYGRKEKSL